MEKSYFLIPVKGRRGSADKNASCAISRCKARENWTIFVAAETQILRTGAAQGFGRVLREAGSWTRGEVRSRNLQRKLKLHARTQ